jgi:hypothetical protein
MPTKWKRSLQRFVLIISFPLPFTVMAYMLQGVTEGITLMSSSLFKFTSFLNFALLFWKLLVF